MFWHRPLPSWKLCYLDLNGKRYFLILDIDREKALPFLIRQWEHITLDNFRYNKRDNTCLWSVDPFPYQHHDFRDEIPIHLL